MAEAPHWRTSLVDVVGGCMEAYSPQGSLAFRWGEEGGFWELMVYSTPGEVVGGADDGALLVPGFSLDVQELMSAFDEVVAVHWRSRSLVPTTTRDNTFRLKACSRGIRCTCKSWRKHQQMNNPDSKWIC